MEKERIELIKQYLDTLEYPEGSTKEEQRYLKRKGHLFTIYKKELYLFNLQDSYYLKKVLNPKEAREAFIQYHHHPLGGHFKYSNTLFKISQKYYWDNMTKDIRQFIKECPQCQGHGRNTLNEPLHPIRVSEKPFNRVGIDVKHVSTSRKGYRYVIVAIDYLTKYVEAKPLRFQTSSEIAIFLYENIITRYSTPHIIHTDNGRPFVAELIQEVCRSFNIIHKTISPYNSQSNGLVERFNATLDRVLQKRTKEEKLDWGQYLNACVFAYNTIKQESTKFSPFYLLYGFEPNTSFDNNHRIIGIKDPSFDVTLALRTLQQINRLQIIRKVALKSIEKSQKNQVKRIESKLLSTKKELKPGFRIGEYVKMYKTNLSTSWSGKIDTKWHDDIFSIHIVVGKGTYLIKNISNTDDTKLRCVHGNKLKSYTTPNVNWTNELSKLSISTPVDPNV